MKLQRGLSLIELMVAIAIVGILASIAYPMYMEHVSKARRADGKSALLNLAAHMERYMATNNTYATATIASGNAATDVLSNAMTEGGWYQISITAQGATTYSLQATPQNAQATDDAACGALTLNNLGVKGITGTGNANKCWSR